MKIDDLFPISNLLNQYIFRLTDVTYILKGVFKSRDTNFRRFWKFDKKNKKYFYHPFIYQIFIDILIIHKKNFKKKNSKSCRLVK